MIITFNMHHVRLICIDQLRVKCQACWTARPTTSTFSFCHNQLHKTQAKL